MYSKNILVQLEEMYKHGDKQPKSSFAVTSRDVLGIALASRDLHSCIWNEVHRAADSLIHLYCSASIGMAKGMAAAAVTQHIMNILRQLREM